MGPVKALPGVPAPGLVYRFAAWVGLIVMRLQRWVFRVEGFEHVPARGGVAIAANHTSFWDFFAVAQFPYLRHGRPVRILAKESLFRLPLIGPLIARTGCIPVDRGNGHNALVHAVTALHDGEVVLLLPEETISRSFDLLRFKTGAVRMAQAAGVPLIPAVSWGSHRFFTSGRRPRFAWKLPVTVRYGEPMHVYPEDDVEVVTKELRARMQLMLDDVIAEYEDGAPAGAWWVPRRLGGGAPDHTTVERAHTATRTRWTLRRR
ncbi:MAG: 1-acyl-sn-glycerol-3-phosphate acyltransferase [Acidimicrobiia bacterium]|nr:1-acyl-sn-glycerol-3-phosphate acyltransferase [Acidimicrobiia bacterium]NNL71355.1 1-acyl-sn-glycerol-3-phosphate acyltransferase [Acidimicrobiia bacterium]